MELRQLAYFVAVAEEAGFTRAAERVHISQSGVSAQIRQLERELGAPLFDRSGRRATVTPAGAAALEHARAALASAELVRRAVDDVTGLIRGRLVLGMVTGCTISPLFDALVAFNRAHPGVEIALLEDNSDELIRCLRDGTADVALIGACGAPPSDLESLVIISEPLVAAVAPTHRLADANRVTLAEIAPHTVVCLPQGTGVRAVFDRACAQNKVEPEMTLEASAPDAIADLAARGLGIAILSESMAAKYSDRLTAMKIDDADTPAVLALVWKPALSPALARLLDYLRDAFVRAPKPASPTALAKA
jgi:DNA-binding transcriptional LysR family regulator